MEPIRDEKLYQKRQEMRAIQDERGEREEFEAWFKDAFRHDDTVTNLEHNMGRMAWMERAARAASRRESCEICQDNAGPDIKCDGRCEIGASRREGGQE